MRFQELVRGIVSRDDSGLEGSGKSTTRRGPARRAVRSRQLALEVMEDRLVLTAVLPTLQSIVVYNGAATHSLTLNGDSPPNGPGAQDAGDLACATFTLPSGYTGPAIRVGMADYTSPSSAYPFVPTPDGERAYLNSHTYFASSSAVLDSTHLTATVYVNLAHCQPGHEFTQELDAFYYLDPTTNLPTTSAPDNHGGLVTDFNGSNYYGYFNYLTPGSAPENLLGGAVVRCTAANDSGAFSQGYYKNHPSSLPAVMAIGNQLYTRAQLVTLLQTNPSGGNATLINVHQLITAYANQENGTPLTTSVSNAIRGSEAIFDTLPILIVNGSYNTAATVRSSTSTGSTLSTLASTLETFNP